MACCPRCGVENKPGRSSCWSCWALLPHLLATVVDPPAAPSARDAPRVITPPDNRPPSWPRAESKTEAPAVSKAVARPIPPEMPVEPAPTVASALPDEPSLPEVPVIAAEPVSPAADANTERAGCQIAPALPALPTLPRELDAERPTAPALPLEQALPAGPATPVTPGVSSPERVSGPSREQEREFAFVAAKESPARLSGSRGALVAIVVVTLLLLAGMLYWYETSGALPSPREVLGTARGYLLALTSSDGRTQQQLATEASKGVVLPPWMAVVTAQVQGEATLQDREAHVPIAIRFAPGDDHVNAVQRAALSRVYLLSLPLTLGAEGWRVDQRAFLQEVQQAIREKNPGVKFPAYP